MTDAVYNQHEFVTEKRAALENWEAELRRIVGEDPAGITPSPGGVATAAVE